LETPQIKIVALSICIISFSSIIDASSRVVKESQDLKSLEAALDLYRLDNYRYPSTKQGLAALVNKNGTEGAETKSYIKKLPHDRWGHSYRYRNPAAKSNYEYDLWSLGRDGKPGGTGLDSDCGNWPSGFDACSAAWANQRRWKEFKVLLRAAAYASAICLFLYLTISAFRRLFGQHSPRCFGTWSIWIPLALFPLFTLLIKGLFWVNWG